MSTNHSYYKKRWLLILLLLVSTQAHAYIGPGAGFAVMGSFLAIFSAVLAGMLAVFTWPIRYLIRSIRYRRAFARSRIKRCVILGLDGMDPKLAEKFMDEGKLPTLDSLRKQGTFKPLATTIPSMSPVAWSSFQTGVNPGKHNIYDFLTRDKQTYAPKLSSTDIRGPRRIVKIGSLSLPIGKPDIRLLRKGKPFWVTLGENGIFSNVLRVPITFPPEKFYGVSLSGMCVPDLRGSQGMFSLFTTQSPDQMEVTGGQYHHVQREGNTIQADLVGPDDPFHATGKPLTIKLTVTVQDDTTATLKIGSEKITLKKDHYSEWIKVDFKAGLGVKVKGICKFLLQSTAPEFQLYVTPINIDPEKPVMPVTHPLVFATYLAKQQGPFATLGLAEDSWALNENALPDEGFIQQCLELDEEREKMFFDSLEKVSKGLCVCVFDGTDRLQHTFWRDIDPDHPAHDDAFDDRHVIEDLYKRMDDLVARTLKKCDDDDNMLMVISDHGFNTFRYGVDLNRWLEENGYLALKDNDREGKYLTAVDWSKTKAFGIGLTGIFLNIKGRESQGIVDPGTEADELRTEIADKLSALVDSERENNPAIKSVYNALKLYNGPYKQNAPDLLVGYYPGYRASWETAVGQVTDQVFHKNTKPWSGDHCIDASFVPGVLFSNRKIEAENPRLMDIGPTVLDMFGVQIPHYMDGKALKVEDK
ncbi:MAG: alkaline phosphatase family protein [Planctomycetota bacterium]|jgi:predicted AlkP superfamily phosphohydrolase/phosphomutase